MHVRSGVRFQEKWEQQRAFNAGLRFGRHQKAEGHSGVALKASRDMLVYASFERHTLVRNHLQISWKSLCQVCVFNPSDLI